MSELTEYMVPMQKSSGGGNDLTSLGLLKDDPIVH